MSATTCSYHPDKIAVTVCERCHRPIYLEDKRIYRKTHYSNNSYGSSSYVTTQEYCPLCYASQKKTIVIGALIGGGIFILFLIFGLGMFLSLTNSMTSTFNSTMLGQSGMMNVFTTFFGFLYC